jgi:hypothetical protein
MCLIVLAALLGPRAIGVVWWLNDPDRWATMFSNPLVPVLGVLVLPWTTLAYVLVGHGGLTPLAFGALVVGFLADLATYGGSALSNGD